LVRVSADAKLTQWASSILVIAQHGGQCDRPDGFGVGPQQRRGFENLKGRRSFVRSTIIRQQRGAALMIGHGTNTDSASIKSTASQSASMYRTNRAPI
jgi:hypothetical protein